MPKPAQKGQARASEWRKWPEQTREHYIRLFSLQERMRAHLKMAQELAIRNYRLKYDSNPRKTSPIRIAGRQDDYLRRYREDQWPEIKQYLKHINEEIQEIKAVYKGGRPPKWYQQIAMVDILAERIFGKMELIQVQLIYTLQVSSPIKESNQAIIDETAKVLIIARDLREVLLFVPLDRAKIGLDEYGFEAILDLSKQHYLDLTQIQLWQRSQQKKTRG